MLKSIFSTTLNRNVELECYEGSVSKGEDAMVIAHHSLERLALIERVTVDAEPVLIDDANKHYIAKVTVKDDTNRSVFAIGEAMQKTLNGNGSGDSDGGEILGCYPYTTAVNRAYDRAVIRFFGLGSGKVFSSNEGVTLNKKPAQAEKSEGVSRGKRVTSLKKGENTPSVLPDEAPMEAPEPMKELTPTPVALDVETDADVEFEVVSTAPTETEKVEELQETAIDDRGGVRLPVGRHKGKTIEESFAADGGSWLKWALTEWEGGASYGELKKDIKTFLASRGVSV